MWKSKKSLNPNNLGNQALTFVFGITEVLIL